MKRSAITDHALIRWMERGRGLDVEVFREQLEALAEPFIRAGVRTAQIAGVWIVIKNGAVITVTLDKPRHEGSDDKRLNGTHRGHDPLPWQAKKRRRNHK